MVNYPRYKKVIWRFVRVFLDSFLVIFGGFLAVLDGPAMLQVAMGVSFVAFLETLWAIIVYPAILAGVIGGIAAVGKLLREGAGTNYDSVVHKIPVG